MISQSASRRRDVDIFNFSFLDILACVIGLLIFVLTIVVASGNGASTTSAAAVNTADHHLAAAKSAAALAADRRSRDEAILSQRAHAVAEDSQNATVVRAQIAALRDETAQLNAQSDSADAKTAGLQSQLSKIDSSANRSASQVAQAQIQAVQAAIAAAEQRALHASKYAPAKKIDYYLPEVQETDRQTLWVEVSGDRLWIVDSIDYDHTTIDERRTRYDRRADAVGLTISSLVSSHVSLPDTLAAAHPEQTVIEAFVRPDGYAAFRQLRSWAWTRGFAVNWSPGSSDSIVLGKVGRVFQQ